MVFTPKPWWESLKQRELARSGGKRTYYTGPDDGYGRFRPVRAATGSVVTTSASATEIMGDKFAPTASYYGLNIPVSMGKRAILGVPIFAGAVKVIGGQRFIDVAYAFGEPGAPDGELIDLQITKLWVNGELVEERNINLGWNSSGALDYVLYPGYEDQFPDPRIEQWLGVNQTPAFRGLIYIVFRDFPLHQFSSEFAIPFVRAEFVDILDNVMQIEQYSITSPTGPNSPIFSDQVIIPNWERQHVYWFDVQTDLSVVVVAIDMTTGAEISRNTIADSSGVPILDLKITNSVFGAGTQEPSTGFIFTQRGNDNQRPVVVFDPYTGEVLGQFGTGGLGLSDSLTGAAAQQFRAPVSRSNTMTDRVICASTFVREEIGFWRIAANGEVSLAYADGIEGALGDDELSPDFGGDVKDVITGDRISTFNKGYGTVIVARERAIYRITVQEGMTGDGQIIDIDDPVDLTPVHLPPTVNTTALPNAKYSNAYIDIVETNDPTNGIVAATDTMLTTGRLAFNFDLVDFGDLRGVSFQDRAALWYVRYQSDRAFPMFFLDTRTLDNKYEDQENSFFDGRAGFEVAVSDDGVVWTPLKELLSSYSQANQPVPMIGPNANLQIRVAWPNVFRITNEAYLGGTRGPPVRGTYVAFVPEAKDYQNGSVVDTADWFVGGRDGLEANAAAEPVVPDLLVPHMIKLWDVPEGYTTQMTFFCPKSEEIVVFFRSTNPDLPDLGDDYITRLEMKDTIRGVPLPVDPFGDGVNELYTQKLAANMANWDQLHHSWNYSDMGSNTLGYGNSVTEEIILINTATGTSRLYPFGPEWKVFGAGANDPEPLDTQERQVWNGAGNTMISQWADNSIPVGFSPSTMIPFQTEITGYPLSDLLRWMSLRVGYTEDEIDTTSVTDSVIGAILLERVPFRDLMNNIGQAYDFDVFESEGKIKFVKALKGGSFVINFPLVNDDLAAIGGGEGTDQADQAPVAQANRNPANELPNAVEMVYLDINVDYQVSSAFARRTRFPFNTTGNISNDAVKFAVPLVMTADEALLRATRLLYRAWGDTGTVEYRVPTQFLTMEPADIVSVPVDGILYQVKNIETVINADHSVSVTASTVSSDEVDVVTAQNPLQLPQTVGGPSASNLFFMQIPPLNSADVNALVGTGLTAYSAVVSKGQASWVSGKLFFNNNFPAFQLAYENGTSPSASGQALGRLRTGTEGMKDHEEELTVLLSDNDGTFATLTEAQILNLDNLCAYGRPGRWELIQVQTVTQVAGDVFTLSNIVRGLYGTEWMSNHDSGDLFITLDRPPVRPDNYAPYDELGSELLVKAVGAKQDEQLISPETIALNGAFERMLPVTNLKATLNGSDIDITWDRRTRLGGVWVDEVEEVPEESTSSTFELEILGAIGENDPIRLIIDLNDPTYKYLNADILTDFGIVPDTLFLQVFHLSTEVGRNIAEAKELDVLT